MYETPLHPMKFIMKLYTIFEIATQIKLNFNINYLAFKLPSK